MAFLDKLSRLRDMMSGAAYDEEPEEEYEFYDDDYEDRRDSDRRYSYDEEDDSDFVDPRPRQYIDRNNKVVSIHTTAQLQVVLVKPTKFDIDVRNIADHLMEKRTVVLNLEQVSKEMTRRFVDFLSGAAYANNGQIKKIANNTYIITPFNVGLLGTDVLDELENNGVFF